MRKSISLICLLGIFYSCSPTRFVVNRMVPTFNEVMQAAYEMNDPLIMKEGLPSNIILLEGLSHISPHNSQLLTLTAQAYCSYALGFIEDTNPERAKKLYMRGRNYAIRALKENKKFRKTLEKEKDWRKAVAVLDEDDVPALFWTGNCWAGWLNLSKKDPKALFDIPNVLAIMERVKKLNDKYFYGGPHLFFALYYAGLPALMGGGPQKAKEEFEKVFEITKGKFLLAKAFYARFYAALIKDEALFDKTIEEVLSTPSDIDPELTLMNEIAKMKARLYKQQKRDLF